MTFRDATSWLQTYAERCLWRTVTVELSLFYLFTEVYLDFACWSILDVVSCYMYSTLSLFRDGSVPVFACVPSYNGW